MQIEVTTDHNIDGSGEVIERVEKAVQDALARFADRLTRVEVHLGDENGPKHGNDDKRCMLEARAAGQKPIVVTSFGSSSDAACSGALRKLVSRLDAVSGRTDQHGRATIRKAD